MEFDAVKTNKNVPDILGEDSWTKQALDDFKLELAEASKAVAAPMNEGRANSVEPVRFGYHDGGNIKFRFCKSKGYIIIHIFCPHKIKAMSEDIADAWEDVFGPGMIDRLEGTFMDTDSGIEDFGWGNRAWALRAKGYADNANAGIMFQKFFDNLSERRNRDGTSKTK